jgi:hypothetical protein
MGLLFGLDLRDLKLVRRFFTFPFVQCKYCSLFGYLAMEFDALKLLYCLVQCFPRPV